MEGASTINVYRVPIDEHVPGWIILCICLTIAILVFMILWITCATDSNNSPTCDAFGTYGVQAGTDGIPLNSCGTSKAIACVFAKSSLADCITECNNLQSICKSFTFNSSTSTMKIVNTNTAFDSKSVNLFVRQTGSLV